MRSRLERKEIPSKFEVARMLVGFNGVRRVDADAAALDVVQSILAGGRTTRLYRKLVEDTAIASDIGAGNYDGSHPGWFGITVELLKDQSRQKAEAIGDRRTRAARRRTRFSRGIKARAEAASSPSAVLAAKAYTNWPRVLLKPSCEAVSMMPKSTFRRSSGGNSRRRSSCGEEVPLAGISGRDLVGAASRWRRRHASQNLQRRRNAAAGSAGGGLVLGDTKRVVLPNGLTLLLLGKPSSADCGCRRLRSPHPNERAGRTSRRGRVWSAPCWRKARLVAPVRKSRRLIEDVGGSLSFSAIRRRRSGAHAATAVWGSNCCSTA